MPGLLRTTLASAVARVPYLSADSERVRHWRERLEGSGQRPAGLTVGVAWEAEQRTAYGRRRSVPPEALAPLARVPGVRLVSLQKGWKGWAGHAPFPLLALEALDEREPFLDTAAAMNCVDLVVSADTSTAHTWPVPWAWRRGWR